MLDLVTIRAVNGMRVDSIDAYAVVHRPGGASSDMHEFFCCKSIAILRKLDWLGKLEHVNVRDASLPLLREPPVLGAPLLEQMHVLPADGSHLYGGYRAVRWLAWRLPIA